MTNSDAVAPSSPHGPGTATSALGPWPRPMQNAVRDYEWGSTTALARLQGRTPTGGPEAELWMGAHPSAPSRLLDDLGDGGGADGDRLDRLLDEHPRELLGERVHGRFGARLPFLLKILAISEPLSVQVHPTADRARAAYEGEVAVAGEHSYVDPYAKPEMLYALEPVDALCGFRSPDDARRLLDLLGGARLARVAEPLLAPGDDTERLEAAFERLVTWPEADRPDLVADVDRAARQVLTAGPFTADDAPPAADAPHTADRSRSADRRALTWATRIASRHPKDPLVAAPFLLDLVRLEPGETLFVPAGAPHAYLYGLAVEIMGSSDNVLRAGLTHKLIAVEELLHVVHGGSRPQRDLPEHWVSPYEVVWTPGVEEFRLSRIWVHGQAPVAAYPRFAGPQIVLCTAGAVAVTCGDRTVELTPGRSAFVGATGGPITLEGAGEVFRAFVGEFG